jgi:DTW domain-containing protein YfiP
MKRWGVLYLGAAKEMPRPDEAAVLVLGRSGERITPAAPILRGLDGLIVLDGTWSQAKTLWWRNPWLLKAHRLVLNPPARSRYGKLRREPRRESLAVIEATAFALARLEGRPELEALVLKPFDLLVSRLRPAPAPPAQPDGSGPSA